MLLHAAPVLLDVLDVKRQLDSDNAWLWKLTIGLRELDEIIERGLRCCRESAALLRSLDQPTL
jgi:hypothetical protein